MDILNVVMQKIKLLIISLILLLNFNLVLAISNVQHSIDGNKVTLTYQGIPPFWINVRGETNIGQNGGYLWAKTYANSFSYDMSFAINPSKKFYYGVKDNQWSNTVSFTLSNTCSNNLSFDEDTQLCMEQQVLNKIQDIRTKLKVCGSCDNLSQPIVSLNGGDKASIYNVYLDNKKVRKFMPVFSIDDISVIDDPQNVLRFNLSYNQMVDGTNSIKFLIPAQGEYFQNRYDVLTPYQTTNIDYTIVKKQGIYGASYFFILKKDTIFDINNITAMFDSIAQSESGLAGLSNVEPYYVIAMPTLLGIAALGGEGNFYLGNQMMSINFGGEKYYNEYNKDVFKGEFAHEYVHSLQSKPETGLYGVNDGFFMEGMADAMAIYEGYRTWNEVGIYDEQIEPGCSQLTNPQVMHTLGRCIFKHLNQSGYLDENFFYRLFHLPGDSYNLYTCDINLQDTYCTSELNKLISYSANQNMTSFIREELLGNI